MYNERVDEAFSLRASQESELCTQNVSLYLKGLLQIRDKNELGMP